MADLSAAATEFRDLAHRLAILADGEINREIGQAIRDAAVPVTKEIRSRLVDYMPDPYAEVLDPDLRLSVTKSTGLNPGVRITATTRHLGGVQRRRLRRLEGGVLAHPLYGNRKHWYNQTSHVVAGFFSGPIEDRAPQIRDAILGAMRRINDKAAGR